MFGYMNMTYILHCDQYILFWAISGLTDVTSQES